jgi:hypothetical protein
MQRFGATRSTAAVNGMRSLRQVLTDLGVDLGSWSFASAAGISDDGRTIAGTGGTPLGYGAWIVVLPDSSAAACDNGLDDDGDGLHDFPADPGCDDPEDPSEAAACEDGLDGDGDTLIDYPADPGCTSALDPSELSAVKCDNGVDDDRDGMIDWRGGTGDPGCFGSNDISELQAPPPGGCGLGPELVLLLPGLLLLQRGRGGVAPA